jgi:hypothetical protein
VSDARRAEPSDDDLRDDYEYLRLLEVVELLDDHALLRRLVASGLQRDDPDVRDAAEICRERLAAFNAAP